MLLDTMYVSQASLAYKLLNFIVVLFKNNVSHNNISHHAFLIYLFINMMKFRLFLYITQ